MARTRMRKNGMRKTRRQRRMNKSMNKRNKYRRRGGAAPMSDDNTKVFTYTTSRDQQAATGGV
jgi:hypothetical protein